MPRFDAEDLDDLPPNKPKRSRSTWLIMGGVAAALLVLGGCLLVAGVLDARRNAERERDMALIARQDADEARFRAEQEGREPMDRRFIDAVDMPAGAPKGGVSGQTLEQLYATNEAEADRTYKGRRIWCTGTVDAVEKREDGSYVMTFVDRRGEKSSVRAYFAAKEANRLANVERGATVHFDATVAGWDRTVTPAVIALRDAQIVPAPPKGARPKQEPKW